jgi:hypothetical protein
MAPASMRVFEFRYFYVVGAVDQLDRTGIALCLSAVLAQSIQHSQGPNAGSFGPEIDGDGLLGVCGV